jgi:aryl carrier-like protein
MSDVIAATEATLCRILAEVLGVDLVRPQDGFFEVGGDSVLALQVVARAREAGLTLGVRDLFDHQTAEALAAVIGELHAPSRAGGDSADTAAPADTAESPLLTFEDGEFGEFEDVEAGQQASGTDVEWETAT